MAAEALGTILEVGPADPYMGSLSLQTQRILGTVMGGILSQIIISIPILETLHSTIEVLWTLWESTLRVALKSTLRVPLVQGLGR